MDDDGVDGATACDVGKTARDANEGCTDEGGGSARDPAGVVGGRANDVDVGVRGAGVEGAAALPEKPDPELAAKPVAGSARAKTGARTRRARGVMSRRSSKPRTDSGALVILQR